MYTCILVIKRLIIIEIRKMYVGIMAVVNKVHKHMDSITAPCAIPQHE